MARGSPPRYTRCPKPGTFSPGRGTSPITCGTSSGPPAAATSVPRRETPRRAGSAHRTQPGPDHRVWIRPHGGGGPGRQRRGGESWSASSASAAESARTSPGDGRAVRPAESPDDSRPAMGSAAAEVTSPGREPTTPATTSARRRPRLGGRVEPEGVGRRHGLDDRPGAARGAESRRGGRPARPGAPSAPRARSCQGPRPDSSAPAGTVGRRAARRPPRRSGAP